MNILVITGSPRKGGNTDIMAEAFAQGARESGNQVTVKNAGAMNITPCQVCEYCFAHDGACMQQDDMTEILAEVDKSDMLVFASPVYWFGMSAQIKLVIDRLYARAAKGFRPTQTALLLNAMSKGVFEAAITQYKCTNNYLKWTDKGIITISGMNEKGSMKDAPELKEVIELGRSIR